MTGGLFNDLKMISTQQFSFYLLFFALLFASINSHAQPKRFIREYTYEASETDSKVSSRQKALTEVKALLIEELGTYVESYVNYEITDENGVITREFFTNEIRTLSTGITETKILEERWNGYEYFVKAEIEADPEEVLRRINQTLSIRRSSAAIDSLKVLLDDSNGELALKNEQLASLKDSLSFQQTKIDATQSSLNALNQQLIESKRQLSSYQANENRILSEIEEIEQKMKTATNNAITNVRIGMTPEEVIQVCGKPRAGSIPHMNYGSVWVIIKYGVVVGIVDAKDFKSYYDMDSYESQNSKIYLK